INLKNTKAHKFRYSKWNFLFLLVIITFIHCSKKPTLKIKRAETYFNNLGGEPSNLHPIKSTDLYSSIVQYYILESLLNRNEDTYEWESNLAKKWSISPDGKSFSFELFENLKWSDGEDLTVKDIKFSFEAYRNPEYGGIRYLPYFEKMESVKILDEKTIQFKIKEPYFKNFETIAGMDIIPEHIYKDPKLKMSKNLIGSGPYKLDNYIRGKILVLKKNPLWSGKNHPANKGKWNFPTLVFRFVNSEADILLRMEKEHLDFSHLSPEAFVEKTKKAPWGTKIKKVEYANKEPSGYGFIGLNFQKDLFKDLKVRKALALLLNRKLMNEKFRYNQSELVRGPWYFWSEYADPTIPPIKFNPQKALQLLRSAGWADKDKNGLLEKTIQGVKKEFRFTLIFANPESEKYLTIYQEDLKKAGIKLNLKILDWSSFLRLLDDKNFDATMLGWSGGSVDIDPKQIWHSASSQHKGSNFISYSNPKVDTLIDKARSQLNRKERIKTLKKVYRLIAKDVPYLFLFHNRKRFYGINKRILTPKPNFNYNIGMLFWKFKEPTLKKD
ncbi:MAG: ABC transporter substrate-binding protein, partial [Bdellovibrionaceae bacterium]|nr:ABC transporter substrate-binding protein [Pseudobdellovibrionaceae bacterium]